jgi:hypothetical protein
MAVEYWLYYLSRNTAKARDDHGEKLMKEELRDFQRNVILSTPHTARRARKGSRQKGWGAQNRGLKRR